MDDIDWDETSPNTFLMDLGYTHSDVEEMSPRQKAYEIAFQLRDWDEVTRFQDEEGYYGE